MDLGIAVYLTALPTSANATEPTRPMFNFKSFRAAGSILAEIELVRVIRKG